MIDPVAALFQFVRANTAITDTLGTVATGTGNEPTIFEETAPPGFEIDAPAIIISSPHSAPRDDTSTCVGREYSMYVRVFARVITDDGATGYEALNDAAEILARTLHNSQPAIDGARTSRISVNGPNRAPTDNPSIGGRVLLLRWNITET